MAHRLLLDWLREEADTRGIYFAKSGEEWEFWPHPRLAQLARRVAWGLVEAGLGQEETVVIAGSDGPDFVAAFFGTILAGAVPAPIASPAAFQDPITYRRHFEAVLEAARPAMLILRPEFMDELAPLAARAAASRTMTVADLAGDIAAPQRDPDRGLSDLAFIQFTSGSTGRCRGVRVPFGALEANLEMIWRWLRWTPADPFATWLPLHHDMGLVGGLLASLARRSDVWLLQPAQFVRQPLRYLRCFGAIGARLSVTAGFGLELMLRRVRPEWLHGMDFSQWRAMVVGGEMIDARVLERWHGLLAPHGFRRAAILPAYGLAEATLAVTGLPLDEEWTAVTPDSAALAFERPLVVASERSDASAIVGCGRPLPGISVAIAGEHGRSLAEGMVGEIVVRGPTLAVGYVGGEGAGSCTTFVDGQLRTGDAGFLLQGQLFVLGRLGDSMKVRSRTVFGEEIELALSAIGVPRQRVVVLFGSYRGEPTAVVLFERLQPEWLVGAEQRVRLHAGNVKLILLDVPRGTIQRTSSGKPKRRELWQSFARGQLNGTAVAAATPQNLPGTA
jgi:acyl-CoA synthetase (AMP-forming)/AMP-acid ligase II